MAYTLGNWYYFEAFGGNSGLFLNREGSGALQNHQNISIYKNTTGTADNPDHQFKLEAAYHNGVIEGCSIRSMLNEAYGLNIYGYGSDMTAEANCNLAIVGGTGTGKSSLVNLIPRFYDATEGQVLVDGVDVREYPLDDLRNRVGMVLQNNVLFSGTIRENLLWGNENATEEEIIQAAKDAQAYDFIQSFPKGFDTYIEQGGVNVSGGQKQRLCIARAMLRKPAILILDDSTSAVDSTTEGLIRESFHQNLKDTTVILIAQRISSVRSADAILVLDNGAIAGIGTHDELMASNKIYQEIYYSQQEGVSERG